MVKLRDSPRYRKQRSRFFVEGFADLKVLLEAGRKVEEIYYTPSMLKNNEATEVVEKLLESGVQVSETSPQAQQKASYRSVANDLVSVMESWDTTLSPNAINQPGPVVVLDEVEKPGNLGAILRSVEAFGGVGVILSDPVVDFFNPNVIRSSRGLIGRIAVSSGSKEEVWEWLQNSGRKIIATSSHATRNLGAVPIPPSTAFIFGSEKSGLGEFWKNQPLDWIKIPMRGTASSLNINVSVACLLYELNRSSA